jgi:hypothetical protein
MNIKIRASTVDWEQTVATDIPTDTHTYIHTYIHTHTHTHTHTQRERERDRENTANARGMARPRGMLFVLPKPPPQEDARLCPCARGSSSVVGAGLAARGGTTTAGRLMLLCAAEPGRKWWSGMGGQNTKLERT